MFSWCEWGTSYSPQIMNRRSQRLKEKSVLQGLMH